MATALAVIGLLVTLLFNTIGVWRSEDQARKSRIATEVSLLTQVGDAVNRAETSLTELGANDKACEQAPHLTEKQEASLHSALTYYDYLAWLFNQGHVTQESAKRYWGVNMTYAYDLGRRLKSKGEVNDLYRELTRFRREAPSELIAPWEC